MQAPLIDPESLFRLVRYFDILAAVVFAVSGSLVASRKGMDVMGFMWFAVITGVGGGTVRDLILGVPVFWVQNPADVSACLVTAVVMHFIAPRVESRYKVLLWFDAFGLALVTVAGTAKAMDVGAPALVAIAMGAVTGSVGGMIRDTLGHVPSILLAHEVYITASVLGGLTYVASHALGIDRSTGMIAGFLMTFTVRGLAIKHGWSLPVFAAFTRELLRSRGRDATRHASCTGEVMDNEIKRFGDEDDDNVIRETSRGGNEPPANVNDRPDQNIGYDEAVKGAPLTDEERRRAEQESPLSDDSRRDR